MDAAPKGEKPRSASAKTCGPSARERAVAAPSWHRSSAMLARELRKSMRIEHALSLSVAA